MVGAPFYFAREDGGAVYVFMNKDHCLNCSQPVKLTGKLESRYKLSRVLLRVELSAEQYYEYYLQIYFGYVAEPSTSCFFKFNVTSVLVSARKTCNLGYKL